MSSITGGEMSSVLVPIEKGREFEMVIRRVIDLYRQKEVRIFLINVQRPFPRHISGFFSAAEVKKFHQEDGMRELEPVINKLNAAGVPHKAHVLVGQKAQEIVRFANDYHCRQIVVAKQPEGRFSHFGLGSTVSQIRHLIGTASPCEIFESY